MMIAFLQDLITRVHPETKFLDKGSYPELMKKAVVTAHWRGIFMSKNRKQEVFELNLTSTYPRPETKFSFPEMNVSWVR